MSCIHRRLCVNGAMDINSDLGLCRAMNPDLVLSSSPVLEDTIASDSSRCHSDQHESGGNMTQDTLMVTGYSLAPWNFCGPWWQHGQLTFNTDPGCSRTTNLGMVLGSRPGTSYISMNHHFCSFSSFFKCKAKGLE